ncbi:MAG: serine/threonine-protein phosphatase [Gammaproteobacteria bacterium]|nr:serine/threonine-protein phosphatase [Gammaproteobacteria bacterium]NIR97144.1 serine/threonine-protein phosphatase [Gammaproteobacteria bacterium]NIT62842.1 serine/threonine-protein phosphatase [Gammaproteobacteria bacterium]NIV19806.1 serine/threonine-protein phosphatase [Gammaproteobacteria bacterium]NIX11339.1 serine/threonine-protein phosphatase [Gammaproteobacteria bacterium]
MGYQIALTNRLGNRSSNQDRCTAVRRDDTVLLVVADGMGGHARGELAAQTVIESMTHTMERVPMPVAEPSRFLKRAIERAHSDIIAAGERQRPPVHPRTTVVACLVHEMKAYWAHVGDSRLYLIREGKVLVRTRDHTYVEDLFQKRAISESDMLTHPLRNTVVHCLGGAPKLPPVTVGEPTALHLGDLLVLCSDGFWGALTERGLVEMLHAEDLEASTDSAAEAAERASYPNADNVSIAALCVQPDLEVDPGEPEDQREDPSSQPIDDPRCGDPLDDAIARIHDALREYNDELDGN